MFGLYVDGLERHLLETDDIDAPTLRGVLVPLLLYADDLMLLSTTAAGLQKQLDALASFCDQRQLTVNLSTTKIVVFEAQHSHVADLMLNGAVVERVESYKYLGFTFHATKDMSFGTGILVVAAKKAMFAMRRRCALLGIRDPALQCKLFDTLVLPILSYAVEVWGVKHSFGEAAEVLHRSFLKHLLGIRKSTTNEIVLAELGRFPLQTHFLQQILRYHHRTMALDGTRLVTLAMMEGFNFHPDGSVSVIDALRWPTWHKELVTFLPSQQKLYRKFDIAAVIEQTKQQHVDHFCNNNELASLVLYRSLQPECQYAEYLSTVKCISNRRLLSRFRCGCHGLHVDTGRWVGTERKDRLCQVCHSLQDVEDEQHFIFDCLAYSHITDRHTYLFQQAYTVPDFLARCESNVCGGFLRECFLCRKCILSD